MTKDEIFSKHSQVSIKIVYLHNIHDDLFRKREKLEHDLKLVNQHIEKIESNLKFYHSVLDDLEKDLFDAIAETDSTE